MTKKVYDTHQWHVLYLRGSAKSGMYCAFVPNDQCNKTSQKAPPSIYVLVS